MLDPSRLKVLAVEPYYGGSHRAFLDGWMDGSRHRWTLLTLPPYTWKWRMRHGAVTLAGQVRERVAAGESWDLLWASDMLSLAEFQGLVPSSVAVLPSVLYMHENQLTYPAPSGQPRDLHYAFSNLVSAFAADAVWFNSAFHRGELLTAAEAWLRRMPDYAPLDELRAVSRKSRIVPQGIEALEARVQRSPGPLRVVWAGRWEHDKNPQDFFAALTAWRALGGDFRLAVLGESFRRTPPVFEQARRQLADHIDHWGYAASRRDYVERLQWGDVVVSTAVHEFFGVSVVEAMAAGCVPLLPQRLAYPEILTHMPKALRRACLYDGTVDGLVAGLDALSRWASPPSSSQEASSGPQPEDPWRDLQAAAVTVSRRFHWPRLRPRLDQYLEDMHRPMPGGPAVE